MFQVLEITEIKVGKKTNYCLNFSVVPSIFATHDTLIGSDVQSLRFRNNTFMEYRTHIAHYRICDIVSPSMAIFALTTISLELLNHSVRKGPGKFLRTFL